jgi:hypothetical protein
MLSRPAQTDQAAVMVKEQFTRASQKLVAEQYMLNAQFLLGKIERRADSMERNAVFCTKGTKNVRFNKVQE